MTLQIREHQGQQTIRLSTRRAPGPLPTAGEHANRELGTHYRAGKGQDRSSLNLPDHTNTPLWFLRVEPESIPSYILAWGLRFPTSSWGQTGLPTEHHFQR